jgi:hypothetical protein
MVGQVKIVHMDEDQTQLPVQVTADHVIAFFEQAPANKSTKAGSAANDDDARLQLKFVKILAGARDVVSVDRGENGMRGREVDYDPKRHLLSARGTQNETVEFYGRTTLTTATSIDWDTITWTPHLTGTILEYRPEVPGVQSPKPKLPDKDRPPYRRGQ